MLSKEKLREEFSKEQGKYYSTRTFQKEGFERRQCSICHKYFWTANPKRILCGDPSHEPYSFIRERPKEISYAEFWGKFSKFFKDRGHEIIDRYPVVSRWRQDLYFTIASIQDFQRIENGRINFEYNANPLLVPQICMRFNDIPNVGITGRHMTSFMMAGQHSFNYPKEGYWRDKTIELNYKVLTDLLGIKKKDLTYIEDVWAMGDFSEYGPCLESFSNGVEIVNSVFTQFEYANGKINELKNRVVDVGWGFERLLWFYTKEDTIYDAVFPKELDYIHKNADIETDKKTYAKVAPYLGSLDATESRNIPALEMDVLEKVGVPFEDYHSIIKPMQASYAIADHTRSLLFAISDGALPSNVGGGYNLRIILRRVFDFMDQYKMNFDMIKLMEMHARDLKPLYKDIDESIGEINEVISVEKRRYDNTKEQALRIVTQIISKNEQLTDEKARTLYESNGITPDFINSVAESRGIKLEIPEEAYNAIIKGDFATKRKDKKLFPMETAGIPKTEKLYYNKAPVWESKSRVLESSGELVVLDKTPFYPEGGGQEADHGTINGITVKDVQNADGVIIHVLEKKADFKKGSITNCIIDRERRTRLMAHHTATHLISAAARSILGKHAWQEGAHKGPNKAHIDISHYEKLSEKQIHEIEAKANSYITHGLKVVVEEMSRNEAESKYGFSIYQGHGVPGSRLRIVKVLDLEGNLIDAEACGGLHLSGMESIVGLVRITGTSRIHDGINRIEFVAGPAAAEEMRSMERIILENSDKEKSILQRNMNSYMHDLVTAENTLIGKIISHELEGRNDDIIKERMLFRNEMLRNLATAYINERKDRAILLYNDDYIVGISGPHSDTNALEQVKELAKELKKGFRGGGDERFAQGAFAALSDR